MTDGSAESIRVVLVTAGRRSVAQALGTVRSIVALDTGMQPVVLATDSVAGFFVGHDLLAMRDVLPADYAAEDILEDEDLLSFAEPFALDHLVERHGRVVLIAAGAMVMGSLASLEEALDDYPLVLTASVVSPASDTAVPHLTLRNPSEPLSEIVIGVSRGSIPDLRSWQQTMIEALFDPDMMLPSSQVAEVRPQPVPAKPWRSEYVPGRSWPASYSGDASVSPKSCSTPSAPPLSANWNRCGSAPGTVI